MSNPNNAAELLQTSTPRHHLSEAIVSEHVAAELKAIVHEHRSAKELERFRLTPRNTVLLHGPAGNGQAFVAEAIAQELAVPFAKVSLVRIVGATGEETCKNLLSVFEIAGRTPCVLFIDDFHVLAGEKGVSVHSLPSIAVTALVLSVLDELHPSTLLVAASERPVELAHEVLDRFDFQIAMPAPDEGLRLRCANRELDLMRTPGCDATAHVQGVAALALSSISAVVKLCKNIRRDLAINHGRNVARLLAPKQR